MGQSIGGDINANYGEVTAVHLKDIRAAGERLSLRTVGVRVGTEASKEHHGEDGFDVVYGISCRNSQRLLTA